MWREEDYILEVVVVNFIVSLTQLRITWKESLTETSGWAMGMWVLTTLIEVGRLQPIMGGTTP